MKFDVRVFQCLAGGTAGEKRDLMQAEVLILLEQLSDAGIEETLAIVRQKVSCGAAHKSCGSCDLTTTAETCRLLLTMNKWERKGYLRWVKAKPPSLRSNSCRLLSVIP